MAFQLGLRQKTIRYISASKKEGPKKKCSWLLTVVDYLHLGSAVLKPELDLPGFQAKSFAKLQSLFLIRMRALFE